MKRVVFSGGGTRCISFFHAIATLPSSILSSVEEWWGCSAGALIATVLAVQQTSNKISLLTLVDRLREIDFRQFRNVEIETLLNIATTWGLDSGETLLQGVSNILEMVEPGASRWTLSDVPGLHIVVTDLTHNQVRVCHAGTHPSLLLTHALRASMSLPFFYVPYRTTEGDVWVDGGVRANFPWVLLNEAQRAESLGFMFGTPQSGSIGDPPRTLAQYILRMVHFGESYNYNAYKNIIRVIVPNFPAWYLSLTPEDRVELATAGRTAGEEFMKVWLAENSRIHPDPEGRLLPSPPPNSPVHLGVERSDTPLPLLPFQLLAVHRNPPLKPSRLNRRWSV
jgi:predicted acylesterase/phospholipase RssA